MIDERASIAAAGGARVTPAFVQEGRAVARETELSVAFVPEQPGLRGSEARLPVPSRELPAGEVAIVRGEATVEGTVAKVLRRAEADAMEQEGERA